MATMRLVDPIVRQEEMFFLMLSEELLDVAYQVIDSDLTWKDLHGYPFEAFCNAALAGKDAAPTHPDVAGEAVRRVLTEDVPADFLMATKRPRDARDEGYYHWC